MQNRHDILPGFDDYSSRSNDVFRACLSALSRPAMPFELPNVLEAPEPLKPQAAAVFITLADFETTFWLDEKLATAPAVAHFLRFHSGAKQVDTPADADFAIISTANAMPLLSSFKTGTAEFPDRSTTLIVQIESVEAQGWTFAGPGIKDTIQFRAAPLPSDFARQLLANRAAFPCGVDLIFTTETHVAALPRSVNLISGA